MGLDGTNVLIIRGPDSMLVEMEANGCTFPIEEGHPEYFQTLQDEYFGDHIKVRRREERFLCVEYRFRNQVPTDYLIALLKHYPKVWIKNEYDSDGGYCGVWIAHMWHGQPSIQEHEWTEPCWEELAHCEDFSKDTAEVQDD